MIIAYSQNEVSNNYDNYFLFVLTNAGHMYIHSNIHVLYMYIILQYYTLHQLLPYTAEGLVGLGVCSDSLHSHYHLVDMSLQVPQLLHV